MARRGKWWDVPRHFPLEEGAFWPFHTTMTISIGEGVAVVAGGCSPPS